MCKMTDTGVRWKRRIDAPGRWVVADYNGGRRYMKVHPWLQVGEYLWWVKPLYIINVQARDWGVRA